MAVCVFVVLVCMVVAQSCATVTPTLLFSSNMVLASSSTRSATIFGYAALSETVSLHDSSSHHPKTSYMTTADPVTGKWRIDLQPYVPTADDDNNFTLTLTGSSGSSPIVAHGVAYGDVILCSGQSNMALTLIPIYNSSMIIANAHHPEIRLFYVQKSGSPTPLTNLINASLPRSNLGTMWVPTTPTSIPQFSGICYLTALELQRIQHGGSNKAVYGLIDAAVGSTDVQSWMSSDMRTQALTTCWTPAHSSSLPPSSSHSPANQTHATELWNAMINPMVGFAFSIMLWDQGENNAHYCSSLQYNCLFGTMIEGWRAVMADAGLPVGFVQLGGYSGSHNVSTIRFAQSDTLMPDTDQVFSNVTHRVAVDVTAMAPTYDLGSPQYNHTSGWWIHCRNKTEVGRRLGLQVAHIWNSPGGTSPSLEWSGPTVVSTSLKLNSSGFPHVEVTMAHADGLEIKPAQGCVLCCDQTTPPDNEDAYVFEVANRAGDWLGATGSVLSSGVVIVEPHNTQVSGNWISAVRFAVTDIPQCVLYNSAELPAIPFSFPVPYVIPTVTA